MQKQKKGRLWQQLCIAFIVCATHVVPAFAQAAAMGGAINQNAASSIPAPKTPVKLSGIESKPQRITDKVDIAFCGDRTKWPTAPTVGMAVPSQLVSIFGTPGVTVQRADDGKGMLRPEAKAALIEAARIAQQNGYSLEITSTYRSLTRQIELFCENGRNTQKAAYPGGSNHGNGVAVDIKLIKGGAALTLAGKDGTPKEHETKLNAIMFAAGFARYCSEAWHFEFGTGVSATVRQDLENCDKGAPTAPVTPTPPTTTPVAATPSVAPPVFTVDLHAGFARVPKFSACKPGSDVNCTTDDGTVTCSSINGVAKCSSKEGASFSCGTTAYGADVCVDQKGNFFRFYSTSGEFRQLVIGEDGGDMLQHYSSLIYRFLAGAIGIIAVLMVVIGGIQIGTSGMNSSGLEEGKNKIIAALTGIALLFLSSLILYTINPNFFSL